MILYPAIDLMGGRVVRLAQGRFDDATIYSDDPEEALARFAAEGAVWAHIVDLDGARAGAPVQHDLLATLARTGTLDLQVAGGFRAAGQLARMFDAGVARVVIGSLAVDDPDATAALFDRFGGDRIALALDVHIQEGEPVVATRGWTEGSGRSLWEVAALYPAARHLLVTDIARDGMLSGPNLGLIARITAILPHLALQASGGVATLADLDRIRDAGAAGAIVGKALWEGRIRLAEALHACA
ncbi:MAG TPA: 1-(5-phosphoribosyl)-5-[(5-phosphoribosylamino)methylideneamino] imidazole-4-carboxamide isomerase [Allosphingosinicella sp.]|jgi:phosphoribosylformimino-5-aminoimidazole carboxamide ribotide isomerase